MRAGSRLQTRASKNHQDPSLKESAMKRLHVHVAVDNLTQSIGFYSALFAAKPAVKKPDYAKWMLEDPRVNFAISTRARQAGLDHLGIQVENADELREVYYARLRDAGGDILEQGQTACCYAKSEKSWIDDPSGIAWETFLPSGESTTYGDGTGEREARVAHEKQTACCNSEPAKAVPACC
jgi:catechol 2,3-dioxygenase-like lactoylglutathione lyase family enzyme